MKIITIIEDNRVTGVVYGEVEIDVKSEKIIKKKYNQVQNIRAQAQTKLYKQTKHK